MRRRWAYLIENGTRIIEVGINGPRKIFVVSLIPRQPDIGSNGFDKMNV